MKKILEKKSLSKIFGGKEVTTGGKTVSTCDNTTCTTTQTDSFDDKNNNGIRDSNESGTSTVTTVCK